MNEKYTKLVENLSKESEELWFEYNSEVNKVLQENQQLKIQISAREEGYNKLEDNWNKLKEYIINEYYMFLPLETSTNAITTLVNKMNELERGVSDEQR